MFALEDDGLVLIEVAPGVDVERDVLARMGFRPRVADDLRTMDPRIYATGPMGLAADFGGGSVSEPRRARARPGRPPGARQPAAQPRHRRAARGARRGARHARAAARTTSGRSSSPGAGERAFSAGSHVGEFESHRRGERPRRHELGGGVSPAGRPADADDRRDRGRTPSAAGSSSRCAATSGSRRSGRRLGLPEVRLAVTPGAAGRSGCRGSSAWRGPRS